MVNEGVGGLSCDPIRVHRYLLAVSVKSECLWWAKHNATGQAREWPPSLLARGGFGTRQEGTPGNTCKGLHASLYDDGSEDSRMKSFKTCFSATMADGYRSATAHSTPRSSCSRWTIATIRPAAVLGEAARVTRQRPVLLVLDKVGRQ